MFFRKNSQLIETIMRKQQSSFFSFSTSDVRVLIITGKLSSKLDKRKDKVGNGINSP